MYAGADIVKLAMKHKGEKYVLGATVNIANKVWSGPWDCAEFVSWACYHVYKQVIAVRPPDVRSGESYSGWWYEDARKIGTTISPEKAFATAGAILIRRPGDFDTKIGHVAISRGDNSTIEAHSSAVGVAVIQKANTRDWTTGFLIPGVDYSVGDGNFTPEPQADDLHLATPFMRGDAVDEVQKALLEKGVNPGPIDGVYGPSTMQAVAAFQAMAGIVVDGVVGPQTRKALFS